MEAAKALKEIKKQIHIPLWQISILIIVLLLQPWKTVRIRSGSIPGNIGSTERIKAVVDVAKEQRNTHSCWCKQWFS